MKRFLSIATVAVLMYGCSSGETAEALEAQKKVLLSQVKDLDAKLEELASKDTTKVSSLPKVTITAAKEGQFKHFFSIQGSIQSDHNVVMVPSGGGLIRSVSVVEGQSVIKGQQIATFDTDVITSNIKEVEEQLILATYNYEKQQRLLAQGVGTEFAMKQAEGQLNTLKQTLETIKTQRGKFVLTAPFNGYIEEVFAVQGEMAGPSTPIVRIVNTNEVYALADISEAYLAKLSDTSSVEVTFPALDNVENLKLSRMGRFVNPANRTIRVRVNLPSNEKYIPNLVAAMKINDYTNDSVIVVPSGVIMEDARGNDIVYVVDNAGEVKEMIVEVGKNYNQRTEILAGLKAGDKIVDGGSHSVYDGLKVEIID